MNIIAIIGYVTEPQARIIKEMMSFTQIPKFCVPFSCDDRIVHRTLSDHTRLLLNKLDHFGWRKIETTFSHWRLQISIQKILLRKSSPVKQNSTVLYSQQGLEHDRFPRAFLTRRDVIQEPRSTVSRELQLCTHRFC